MFCEQQAVVEYPSTYPKEADRKNWDIVAFIVRNMVHFRVTVEV